MIRSSHRRRFGIRHLPGIRMYRSSSPNTGATAVSWATRPRGAMATGLRIGSWNLRTRGRLLEGGNQAPGEVRTETLLLVLEVDECVRHVEVLDRGAPPVDVLRLIPLVA